LANYPKRMMATDHHEKIAYQASTIDSS